MTYTYYVYLVTNNHNSVLYTGVTNDLKRRVFEHREGRCGNFTSRYKVRKLVYYEITTAIESALAREKQIKAGSRQKKLNLIEAFNPDWDDLYDEI